MREQKNTKKPQSREKSQSRSLSKIMFAGALLWLGVPILVLSLLIANNKNTVFAERLPSLVPVTQASEGVTRNVEIALSWRTAAQLVAPAWSGIVQKVYIANGAKIESGSRLLSLDGVDRIAWNSPGAFYRPLHNGDTGEDVSWLKSLLSAKGYKQNDSSQFDWLTLTGLRSFVKELGVKNPQEVNDFDPTLIVFMSEKTMVLQEVALVPSSPAPAAGSTIAKGSLVLDGAALVQEGTVQQQQGPAPVQARTRSELDALVESSGLVATKTEKLFYGQHSLTLNEKGTELSPESLTALASLMSSAESVALAQLRGENGEDWWFVPPGAIAMGQSTRVCISRNGTLSRMPATVISSDHGTTIVSAKLRQTDRVRVPAETQKTPCQ